MSQGSALTPFFIFGSPRSGTSLLSRMVDSHEHLVVPNESLIFKMFSSFIDCYGDLSQLDNQRVLLQDILATRVIGYWQPKPDFETVSGLIKRPGFAGVIEALICSTATDKDLRAWGEKSPGHVFYWNEIKREFPEAKAIHIVRDGRDVASSIINARMGPKTYHAAARMWRNYLAQIEKIKQECNADQFIEVRYESLLTNPQENLQKICDLLSVTYSDSMLNFFEKDTNYQTDKTNLENLRKPLIADNQEKWRNKLSVEDLQEFETVAGDVLNRFGYATANKLGSLPSTKLNYLKYLKSPAIRFVSRAKDVQGHKEFLSIKGIKLKRKFNRL